MPEINKQFPEPIDQIRKRAALGQIESDSKRESYTPARQRLLRRGAALLVAGTIAVPAGMTIARAVDHEARTGDPVTQEQADNLTQHTEG